MIAAKLLGVLLFVLLAALALLLGMRAAGDERLTSSWATVVAFFCAIVFAMCAIAVGALA